MGRLTPLDLLLRELFLLAVPQQTCRPDRLFAPLSSLCQK